MRSRYVRTDVCEYAPLAACPDTLYLRSQVDACVEGTSDVVPHTEDFLVGYKQFSFSGGQVQHRGSGLCLTALGGAGTIYIHNHLCLV